MKRRQNENVEENDLNDEKAVRRGSDRSSALSRPSSAVNCGRTTRRVNLLL